MCSSDLSDSIVPNSCNDYKGITMELPTWDGLQKMVCSVAGGNANDAQLLWGLLQIEGGPMTRQVRAGATSMSCGDIILNTCGASQIFGVIVPACADQQACPGSAFAFEDGTAGQKYRDGITTDVACSVRGQMEYILQKRKGEMGEMRALYQSANGRQPTTDQLYYMMAGRNYGVKAEFLTKDACQGSPPVEGCSGANYCQCAMDTFTFSCN